jgi:hypothetical protein
VSIMYRDRRLARFERDVCGWDSGVGFQAPHAQESARAACFRRIAQARWRPVTTSEALSVVFASKDPATFR